MSSHFAEIVALPALPGDGTPRWTLQLLGRFQLSDGSRTHARLATRAVMALLARLAMWPHRDHAREELVELLWPGVDANTGRRRLRQALSLLKQLLEPVDHGPAPVVQADRLSLRLVPGSVRCDVRQFERLVQARRPADALAAYGGDLLPGFYDDWIQDERLRLAALHSGLEARMPAPALTSGPAAAMATATATATAITPVATTGTLAFQITGNAGANLTGDAATLPLLLTRYIATAEPLQQLRDTVGRHRWVTVTGPGGSGKTRLVVELARQLQAAADTSSVSNADFDRVLFVPLVSASTGEQVLALIGKALRISTPNPTHEMLVARLAGWKTLLVLDNVEQLVGIAEESIGALPAALPRLHLLLTSRRPLGADGERQFAMSALPLPASPSMPLVGGSLAALRANPAMALFVDRASAVRMDFHLSTRNAAVVAALVTALEGMPLAIELAASRLRSVSPAEMLARLQPATSTGHTPQLDLLARPAASPGATRDPRHASMQRTIAWSWDQLSPPQRDLAGTMAVFSGGCSAAMLQQVHGQHGDGASVLADLDQLLAHALARQVTPARGAADDASSEEPEAWRFQLSEPVREYASAQFATSLAAAARSRHRVWVTAWARQLPQTPLLANVRAEVANVAAALHSARHDGAGADAVHLLLAMGHTREDIELPAAALEDAGAAIDACPNDALRSRGHSALGPMLFAAGRTQAALRHVEAALQHTHADPALQGHALYALARLRWRTGLNHPEHVLPLVDEADALAAAAGDVYLQAGLLSLRAWATQALDGTPQRALALHQRALLHWSDFGNRHAVNLGRYNVAVFEFECGRPLLAGQQLDDIAAEADVLQDWRRVGVVDNARGSVLSALRRWPEALQALRGSLRLSWQAMSLYNLAYDLWNLPRALAHARMPARALTLMAFAEVFWQQQYGALTASDRFDLRRVDRLAARQLSARACAEARAQGRLLSLADAVALALADA